MSTTHLIAINGDFLTKIVADKDGFIQALALVIATSGTSTIAKEDLEQYVVTYLGESMNGVDGALAYVITKRKRQNDEVAIEMLDNVSASLDNVMGHLGHLMTEDDRKARTALVQRARLFCDALLRR
jgi:N-acetylglucosamine kinase-like BadF-type ATPase